MVGGEAGHLIRRVSSRQEPRADGRIHRIFVTGLLAVAAALILLGLACLVFLGFYQIQPSGTTVQILPGQAPTDAQSVANQLEVAGLVLVVLGAIIFRTSCWWVDPGAPADAPRPPAAGAVPAGVRRRPAQVVDGSMFGGPSLVERFTLRRFDSFEEVLVRHLRGTAR